MGVREAKTEALIEKREVMASAANAHAAAAKADPTGLAAIFVRLWVGLVDEFDAELARRGIVA